MNNILMNIISIIFVIGLILYSVSVYKKRKSQKERIYSNSKEKILYLFVDFNINLMEINKETPVPLAKEEYLQFKKIPKRSKGYVFEYTNILELKLQYAQANVIKKNVTTDKLDMVFNVRPEKVYYLHADTNNKEGVSLKFSDITNESL